MPREDDLHRLSEASSFASLTDPKVRAAAARAKNLRVGLYSVGAVAFLAMTMAWNPPSDTAHSFTTASDYKASRDSGCTNSGEGCHGDETEYTDFNAYHPDTECGTCHEHEGVGCIPCHSSKGHECQSCHDGTDEKAGDQERITDPYPRGHYRETTHTAIGTDFSVVMRATKRGKAGAECRACHDRDLYKSHQKVPETKGSPYGDSIGCGECHNDARSGGLEQVLADWEDRSCEVCHAKESSSPMHSASLAPSVEATDAAGCGSTGPGCHQSVDLHALHPDRPKDCSGAGDDDEPICHNLKAQAHVPEEYRCGDGDDGCHITYESDEYSHDEDARLHRAGLALALAQLVDPLTSVSTSCGSCHLIELTDEHSRPSSALGGDVCRACHGYNRVTAAAVAADWPRRATAGACLDCHGRPGIPAPHGALDSSHEGQPLDDDGTPADSCSGDVCHEATDVRELHAEIGCTITGCHGIGGSINGSGLLSCGGNDSDLGCHVGYSSFANHKSVSGMHDAVEMNASGQPDPGSCVRSGCHVSNDLAELHTGGCEIDGCHVAGTRPSNLSCGGPDAEPCHTGYTSTQHFADHNANRSGTVNGITYTAGENTGCFGCHSADLVTAHTGTSGAPIAGGGATSCRVCHTDSRDPGNGRYAGLDAVKSAIARRDTRCISCHDSGSATPGNGHAASPHKRFTTQDPRPAGFVWSNPFAAWRGALNAPVGGGHNVVAAATVGANADKNFPMVEYSTRGTVYRWALPPNTGDTAWLKPINGQELRTEDEIRHAKIACDDCHVFDVEPTGPHGSAVKVRIDPAYSQTQYANPTRGLESQFAATGTDRVICMKCHRLSFGSVEGSDDPGGNPVHAQHAKHIGAPVWHPLRYGEKCVDCHIRIPHASLSPRLLVRTVSSPDRPADTYPYIAKNHDGLAGVLLRTYDRPTDLTKASCVTGGCHGYHSDTNHPEPSDVPTATYWP
ncbi:MAG: hypothetical protein U1E26_11510 [Coriobacteriia bacterium]|nr:hypothetical protein [Coriobacteriia bacterium]